MNKVLLLIVVFSLGYVANDILRENNIELVNKVYADVAGMNQFELESDYAFRGAVEAIVTDSLQTHQYSLNDIRGAVEAIIEEKMDRYALRQDYDFKSAVEDIIEDCDIDGRSIDC